MNELGNTLADKNYKPSGISKAEEAALKAYPINIQATQLYGDWDINKTERDGFAKGYEQAEEYLTLTWEDIRTIVKILADSDWYDFEISDKLWSQEFYEEVLKRFKEAKK